MFAERSHDQFFRHLGQRPMLIGNRNLGFELQGPKNKWNIDTFDQLGFGAADGNWDFPNAEIKAIVLP